MRVAIAIELTDEERATLTKWSRGRSTPARLVQRAQIVLAAAAGRENQQIAAEIGCTRRTVGTWRSRFAESRLPGIEQDAPRAGRTAVTRAAFEAEILRKTTQETPPHATQWSTRTLAKAIGCTKSMVERVWRDNGLQPHRTKSFKVSNDPQFAETRISYDDAGRRTQVIENVQESSGGGSSSSTSSSGDDCEPSTDTNRTTEFTYTSDGQLATLTAWNAETGNQTTTYTYGTTLSDSDVASSLLLRTTKYPDSPGTGGTDVVTLAYNRQGERKQLTDQRGCVHQYVYDGLGRPIHDRVTTLGTNVDGAVLRLSTTYEIRGGIASQSSYDSATVGSGSIVNQVAFRYNDFVQRYESWQSHSGAVNFTSTPKVVSAYADGSSNTIRPTSLTYPNGREIASDYGTSGGMEDCVSRVASLIDDDSTILADYEYLGLGAVVSDICLETGLSYTLIDPTGGTDPDTGDIYGGLDRFSRVKDVRWRKSGSDVSRVQYGYDRASNRTWRRNPSDSGNHYDWLYSYDGLHRLKHADRGTLDGGHTSIGSPQFAQCWTLDETGNWSGFRQSDSGSSWSLVQTRISNAANEINSIGNSTGGPWTSPSYDAAGNMLNIPQPASPGSGYWATYDAWNRLVTLKSGSQTVQENEYDARNYRTVRKSYTSGSLTETRHAYYSDGWQVLEERVGSSSAPDRHFVWGLRYIDDLILRDRTTSGTLDERLYALQDGNWNVTAVADESGAVQERYEYDPYGLTTVLTPSFGSRGTSSYGWETTYAGYRWDAGTGLFAVRNRYFHPRLGAWVSRDPIGLWNYPPSLYEYVWSSPVSHSDRLGLAGEALPGGSWNPVNWPGQITYPVFKFVGDVWYDNYGDELRIRGKQADLDMRAQATDGGRSCDELRGKIRDQNQRPIPKTWNSTIQQAEVAVAGSYGNYPGFVGCRRAPLSNSPLQPIRNNPAVINGRRYTGHALDQMSNRGIPPSVVEDTLRSGKFMGQSGDKYVWETSNAKVITNINGDVVTVVPR